MQSLLMQNLFSLTTVWLQNTETVKLVFSFFEMVKYTTVLSVTSKFIFMIVIFCKILNLLFIDCFMAESIEWNIEIHYV